MIRKIINKIRSFKRRFIREILPVWVYKSRFWSSVYYSFIDHSFEREHQAVLVGKVRHLEETKKQKSNYFLLVRNTHRIEKGLLMRPQRPVFGKDYIGETIDSFEGVWDSNKCGDNPQMKWFHDVLSEYFSSAGRDPAIVPYYKRFRNKIESSAKLNGSLKSIPYCRQRDNHSDISFDEFYKLVKQRRSVRWFTSDPVPRELIDKAIMAGNQSPSACNRQPFEFRIFDNPDLLKRIVNYPMGTKGYGHNIPVMIVLVGNLDAYFDERDRHVIYIDASLAAMSFMLALETLGLSSCPINWPDVEEREKKMETFLSLRKFQRPLMCIGVGYPDESGKVAFSEKRPLTQMRKYNYE